MRNTLLLVLMLTINVNADLCKHHIDTANKYLEKVLHRVNPDLDQTYLNLSIDNLLDAKYSCNPILIPDINARIKDISKLRSKKLN